MIVPKPYYFISFISSDLVIRFPLQQYKKENESIFIWIRSPQLLCNYLA